MVLTEQLPPNEWTPIQILRSTPYVGWLLVLSLVPKVFFYYYSKKSTLSPTAVRSWSWTRGHDLIPRQESRFRNQGKFLCLESVIRKTLLVESEILGFGIPNTAQGIRNPTIDWNPESKLHWKKSGIQGVIPLHAGRTIKLEFLRTP